MTQKTPLIGFLCGSLRKGSINKKLEIALTEKVKTQGASLGVQTREINLSDYDLPLYHGDLAKPQGVDQLIADMKSCDGIIITSPEYNGSLPPVLKNAIDWTSTVTMDHFSKPVFGIASCSPGAMSGIMGLRELAYILTRLGGNLVPIQLGVGHADSAFTKDGALSSQEINARAEAMISHMLDRIKNTHL